LAKYNSIKTAITTIIRICGILVSTKIETMA